MTTADEVGPALAALAAELARAEAAAAALDEAVGRVLAGGPATGLQDLDRLRQMLADLAAFAGALAGTATGAADLRTALAAVRSGDVAARLTGREARRGEDELWEI